MADVITSHFRLKSHQHSESRTLPTIPPRALKEARRPRPHPAPALIPPAPTRLTLRLRAHERPSARLRAARERGGVQESGQQVGVARGTRLSGGRAGSRSKGGGGQGGAATGPRRGGGRRSGGVSGWCLSRWWWTS